MEESILTKNQVAFLTSISRHKYFADNFYLTGGTALAAFYLQHRYSEDLDFFSEHEFDILSIDVLIKQLKKPLGIVKVDFQKSYNRNLFFLHFKKDILKVEFTFFPFTRIEKGQKKLGITIDSFIDIAVNKLFTIYQRTYARDYIDLYCISKTKNFSLNNLINKAKLKFDWHIDPIQLGSQFVKVKEAKDLPRMIKKIPEHEWQDFFITEAKKLKRKIFE